MHKRLVWCDPRCRVGAVRTALGAFLTAIAALNGSAVFSDERQSDVALRVDVEDPRPVAEAMALLMARHGYVITYEDPPYTYEGDILDVTNKVRRDLDRFEPGKAPKVLIPKGGTLNMSYFVSSDTGRPADPGALIQEILDAHTAANRGGVFRFERMGEVFHVVPARVMNRAGKWVDLASILDVSIVLPDERRTVLQIVREICAAVSEATQARVELGTIPTNLFMRHTQVRGASHEPARDVLMRTLDGTGKKLTWRLFYGPGPRDQTYSLNIRMMADRK